MSGDLGLFFGQLLKKPHQVVALAPSTRALAQEMVCGLNPLKGPVIELGAGTGRITKAILQQGIAPEAVHSIELNPVFCAKLARDHPGLNVHDISAGDVGKLPIRQAQAVISGLPLLSMPADLQAEILFGSFRRLAPGGVFVQFTYGPRPPIREAIRDALGLDWSVSRKVWGNLPPARVYRFRKATGSSLN